MIKAIIIDDEANCQSALQNDIKTWCPGVEVAAVCSSATEGMLAIRRLQPELIFLDVEMPRMNGLQMLEALGDISCQIIFTTAYDQFAARAFRVSAVDYLLKPIAHEDLVSAVQKAISLSTASRTNNTAIANLLHNAQQPEEQQKIAIPNRHGYDFISVTDILYCRADGAYTNVILKDRKLLLSKSLGETEQMLPVKLFERAHHSLLINITRIKSYSKTDGYFVVMDNGEQLSVSRTRKEQLLRRLGVK